MAQFSLFQPVTGNNTSGPASSTAFGPGIIQGLSFKVTQPGMQLDGFYYWRADSGEPASASFVLWNITGAGTGSTVAGTSVSTSSAVIGQWNYIPLASPVALTSGQEYMAVIGFAGNFADTHPYFGGAGPAAAGITSGPLYAYMDSSGSGGTAASNPQCAFTTGTSNPSLGVPTSSNTSYNCWIDVLVESPAAAPASPARPGRTWQRQFKHRQAYPQRISATSIALGDSGTGTDTFSAGNVSTPLPALAGRTWRRQFDHRQSPVSTSTFSVAFTDSGAGTDALAPGIAATAPGPLPPAAPGRTWQRQFRHRQTYPYLPASTGGPWRLMDGVAGRPGNGPAAGTSYSGPYIAGVMFDVTTGGTWFGGYWWWVAASGQDTTPVKCALWQITGSSSQALVPGSVVTSGTLTAGQWNYIPLPVPLLLAPCAAQSYGALYLAAVGYTATSGFPETKNQFGAGQPYSGGITNGPLNAPSSITGSAQAGSAFGGWTKPQMAFTTAGSDPSVLIPGANDSDANLWVDVQVSGTPPAGAAYKSFAAAPAFVSPGASAQALAYTIGLEFVLSQPCALSKIWHYSPPSATVLPTRCAIWDVTSQAVVPGTDNQSPAWKKQADGSAATAGSGWIWCDYSTSGVTLNAGQHYKAAVFTSDNTDPWFLAMTGWWGATPGPFASGVTGGPLRVVGNAESTQGQDSWNQGITWTYPATGNISSGGTESPEFDGLDVEVTAGANVLFNATLPNQSGRTWLRQFKHRQTFPYIPLQVNVASIGLADSGAGTDTFSANVLTQLPLPQAAPGKAWLRNFKHRQQPLYTSTFSEDFADSGSGTDSPGIASAVPLADSGAGADALTPGQVFSNPLFPATPGKTWARRFKHAQTYPYLPVPANTFNIALADSGTGSDTFAASITTTLPLTLRTGKTWQRQFKHRQVPLYASTFSEDFADSGAGTDVLGVTVTAVLPAPLYLKPGKTWLHQFKHRQIPLYTLAYSINPARQAVFAAGQITTDWQLGLPSADWQTGQASTDWQLGLISSR